MPDTMLPPDRLNGVKRLAFLALGWERLWPLILPLVAVVSLFLAASWLGLWPMLADPVRYLILGAFAVAALAALLPLRGFRLPDDAAVNRRIERSSGLAHAPVQAQVERQAVLSGSDDPLAQALWAEHRKRQAAQLSNLRAGTPSPSVASRDPWALRGLVALVLFVGLFAGWNNLSAGVSDAFTSQEQRADAAIRLDAWVTPPLYTQRPPILLNRLPKERIEAGLTVPENSVFTVRTSAAEDVHIRINGALPAVETDIEAAKDQSEGAESAKPEKIVTLKQDSLVEVLRGETVLSSWQFAVTPDQAPTISFVSEPETTTRGALEFTFLATDDYGIAEAQGLIEPSTPPGPKARPLVEPPELPLPAPRRSAKPSPVKSSRDFAAHPWAGSMVRLRLTATDHAGQSAESAEKTFKLPGRIFTQPLAQALVFERRRLAMDAEQARSVASMLNIITSTHPEVLIGNLSHYTALRVAYRHIRRAKTDDALREGLYLLWEIALAIEDGNLSQAERRLREAQERLADALERGATDEEIERLMEELRSAMNEFMRELAQRMQQNQNQAMQMPENSQTLRQQDLDRLMQQIEDLAKSGSQDQARELLRQLQDMMNNLQMAQPNQQQRQQDPFSEQMNKLSEMMRRQQELMDQTFDMQRRQEQQRNGQQQQQQQGEQGEQQQGQNGQQRPMTAEELAEALEKLQQQQGELQKQLQEMQQAMRELGIEPGEQMGQAGEEMGKAEGQLGEGETGEATGSQGRALQAMREGAQQMMRNMQQQAGEQGRRGERGQHGEQRRGDTDPLGRQSRSRSPQLGDDVKVPDEIDAQRAREILDAIRRRLGETMRPKFELDYLDRLLPTR